MKTENKITIGTLTLIAILIFMSVIINGCKTWEWGDTINYTIPEGEHAEMGMPFIIDGTEKWGGEMTLEYNPDEMIDTVENFSYWNKLGGIMPDINDNYGSHQSARAAWRVDPEDTDYFYVGYIVYVQDEPQRGYLLDYDGNKIRIRVGETFFPMVTLYSDRWGVYVRYGNQEGSVRVEDDKLRWERFVVVMDPYYGGNPVAPTDIFISLKIIDTHWNY